MLLLCLDASILIFITISLGILLQKGLERVFRVAIRSDTLGIFLAGLILSTIYFNLVSFWVPVNYLTLIPLAAVSLLVFNRFRSSYRSLFSISRQWPDIRGYLLPLLCLALLLFIYGVKPPTNPDSVNYHFLSILWGEKYKVVPGLANLQEAYAFNPAAFIIQSAYSFTDLAGRSLYPLNGVMSALFLFWILARVLAYRKSLAALIYFFFLVISYRYLLGNLSSPTSDQLVQICLSYALMRISELILSGEIDISGMILPSMILLYAPIAKMSACSALLPLFFIFCLLLKNGKRAPLLLVLLSMALLIYLPWIGRNYIMSGYPVYPFPFLSPFHPDWKVPIGIVKQGVDLMRNMPRMLSDGSMSPGGIRSTGFSQWIFRWIGNQVSYHSFVELFILGMSLGSPLLWILWYARKKMALPAINPVSAKQLFFFWLILYSICWLWLVSAPDYRYGIPFLTLCMLLPLLMLARIDGHFARSPSQRILSLLFILSTCYYLYGAYGAYRQYATKNEQELGWKEGWIVPLRDIYYKDPDSRDSFPYRTLNTGVKLYLSDTAHLCINTGLICTNYGDSLAIEMRGPHVEDGFRPVSLSPAHLP
jgi:hypothetical protein